MLITGEQNNNKEMLSAIFHLLGMKSYFGHSGLVFTQFWVLRQYLKFVDKIINFFLAPFVPFIVFKMTVSISRLYSKNQFEKWAEIFEKKTLLAAGLVS